MTGDAFVNVMTEKYSKGIIEYTLTNNSGMTVKVINIGCSITEILVPDSKGKYSNVVLRYENLEEYFKNEHFIGAVIAPIAGRLEGSEFNIDDEIYSFTPNENGNLLHSGDLNPYNEIWESSAEEGKVIFRYKMGAEYPGRPLIKVTYSLSDEDELKLEYEVSVESKSLVAPTNHTYFNLANGQDVNTESHLIRSNTSSYLKMKSNMIPESVEKCENLFDLKQGRLFRDIYTSDEEQIRTANGGFDHYFVFEKDDKTIDITEKNSGRTLRVTTNFPGMVMYTGNNMGENITLKDRKSQKNAGFCIETQESPSSLKLPLNQKITIDAGDIYLRETVFQFGLER